MKKIYIVLTQTGTILSRIIKYYTGNQYNHVSIALDENLFHLYSFGRKNAYVAFIGGFVREGINIGTFKRFHNTKAKICSLEVTDQQYYLLYENIKEIEKNKDKYKFNVLGLFMVALNKKMVRENRFYCSEFVSHILKESNIDTSDLSDLATPQDFENISGLQYVYSGYLRDYNLKNENSSNIIEYKFKRPIDILLNFSRMNKERIIRFVKRMHIRI